MVSESCMSSGCVAAQKNCQSLALATCSQVAQVAAKPNGRYITSLFIYFHRQMVCTLLFSDLDKHKSSFLCLLFQGEGKKLASSTSFFNQLQEEVQTNVRAKKAAKDKKKKPVVDASKLML